MVIRIAGPDMAKFGKEELPGRVSLSRGSDGLIGFVENNTKNPLTIFDTSFLTGPHFSYRPDRLGPRLPFLSPVEHAIYGDLLKNPETVQRMGRYYDALARMVCRENTLITPWIKGETERNLYADIFRLKVHNSGEARGILGSIGKLYAVVRKKEAYSPDYKIEKKKFIGAITEWVWTVGRADLEGVACFFELYGNPRKVALVSADGGQVDVLKRNAKDKGLNIESRFCPCGGRQNSIILSA